MLAEYALIPDIFDTTCYSSPEVCGLHLQHLKEALIEEALVRDLRDGEWFSYIKEWMKALPTQCHPKAKELLKKLATQKRLRTAEFCSETIPTCPADWCKEAIASHSWQPLNGVITSATTAKQFEKEHLIASIEKLQSARWWQDRGHSIRLYKRTSDYLRYLQLVLSHANSVLLIDPFIDPTQRHYQELHHLIQAMRRPKLAPLLEIHVAAKGFDKEGKSRREFTFEDWRYRLSGLSSSLRSAGLSLDVFVWDNFHDRYIISDIVGINLNGGLDINVERDEETTWNRLTRTVKDDIQREFVANSGKHQLLHQFKLP
jgi:hypothetical protein